MSGFCLCSVTPCGDCGCKNPSKMRINAKVTKLPPSKSPDVWLILMVIFCKMVSLQGSLTTAVISIVWQDEKAVVGTTVKTKRISIVKKS